MPKSRVCCRLLAVVIAAGLTTVHGRAQTFGLEQVNDSLYHLTLTTDSTCEKWILPFPIYRFCTGDVNGDETDEAIVGVVKATRFFKEKGRRILIFKNFRGRVRPLWMGSRLGGTLHDFRLKDGKIRSLETTGNGHFVVAEYKWSHFGMRFERFLAKGVTRERADTIFNE